MLAKGVYEKKFLNYVIEKWLFQFDESYCQVARSTASLPNTDQNKEKNQREAGQFVNSMGYLSYLFFFDLIMSIK